MSADKTRKLWSTRCIVSCMTAAMGICIEGGIMSCPGWAKMCKIVGGHAVIDTMSESWLI